ncbi:MAG TPA: acyltransferase, partial [Actinoplanes sp.]|nr:acyltransferase [Actinoplanes sp.]
LAAAAVGDVRRIRTPLAGPVLVKLGELSFAFYLVHLLVIRVVELVAGYHPRWDAPAAAGLAALTVVVSLGCSWLLHTAVENPARRTLIARR